MGAGDAVAETAEGAAELVFAGGVAVEDLGEGGGDEEEGVGVEGEGVGGGDEVRGGWCCGGGEGGVVGRRRGGEVFGRRRGGEVFGEGGVEHAFDAGDGGVGGFV